ncbi:hypothetical protein [Leadbetterella byssophila]|uniref:hypothetical protein n=1 Tax=Leadbetterella byssophila TaxID=316068 RepID=UPI0039A253FB
MKKLLIFLLPLVWACGSKKSADLEDTLEKYIKKSDESNPNSCLMKYQDKLDDLLTLAMVCKATGFNAENADTSYSKIMRNPEYHKVNYSFKNKRMGKVPALDGIYELNDQISVGAIKPMTLEEFNRDYKPATEEQVVAAKEALDDALENNEEVKEIRKKAETVSDEQIKKTGGVLVDMFKKISEGYRNVEGIGGAARWNIITTTLNVWHDGTHFELVVNIDNDVDKNKQVALSLAKEILAKCR